MIWSDSFLSQLSIDAEQQINKDVQCIFSCFCLPTQLGVSVITLPSFVRSLLRITWRGYGLDQLNWLELTLMTPATVFVAPGSPANVETTISRPLYYAMHPTNPYDVRLYPTPNETFSANPPGVDPYGPTPNQPSCVVSCYRNIDATFSDPTALLPAYADRRTRKAYALWKAFSAEGPGQNLAAASYYQAKYTFLVDRFRQINQGAYVGKQYGMDDRGLLTNDGYRYPRPTLNPNFERTIF